VVFVQDIWDDHPGPTDVAVVVLDDGAQYLIHAEASVGHDYVNICGLMHSATPAELCARFIAAVGLDPADLVWTQLGSELGDWPEWCYPVEKLRPFTVRGSTADVRVTMRMLKELEAQLGIRLDPAVITLKPGEHITVDATDAGRTVFAELLPAAEKQEPDDVERATAKLTRLGELYRARLLICEDTPDGLTVRSL
jgi:hypothetical protein